MVRQHISHTERTESINQPSTSLKRQVSAEELAFHNPVRVSVISPCVWHERPYQLSQQILSRVRLISDRLQQVGACDIERVNAECLYPRNVLEGPWKSDDSERALNGWGLEEVFGCSWENHVSVCTVCASFWAESILSQMSLNTNWASAEKVYSMLHVSYSVEKCINVFVCICNLEKRKATEEDT